MDAGVHELLQIGAGSLGSVTMPGLETAARAVLKIWDTLQQVDVDLLSFSRVFPTYL